MAKEGLEYDRFEDTKDFVVSPLFVQAMICADTEGTRYARKKITINVSYSAGMWP